MLDTVDSGKLLAHMRKQDSYYEKHGSRVWALRYQTEVRTRSEHFLRVRRELLSDYEKELSKHIHCVGPRSKALRNLTHGYDPNRPRVCVFVRVLKDTDWWLQQMELPLLEDSSVRLPPAVEGDVPVRHAPGSSRPTAVADYTGHTGQVVVD